MYSECTPAVLSAGVPFLKQLQNQKYKEKVGKVHAVTNGLGMLDMHGLLSFVQPLAMPPSLDLLLTTGAGPSSSAVQVVRSNGLLWVPLDPAVFGVHGAVLTGKMQVGWIGQLVKRPGLFDLHVDGKYKLHFDGWELITCGTHSLRHDPGKGSLSQTYDPLTYLFCKENETVGSCKLVMEAVNYIAKTYFGEPLKPRGVHSDHAPAIRRAFEEVWPEANFTQDWAHLIRKFIEGEYIKNRQWQHFEEVENQLRDIHMAHTDAMKMLLIVEAGARWDSFGKQMDIFWDNNLVTPWDCWSLSDCDGPLEVPLNQTQERYHRTILEGKIPGMFKGSTEHVFAVALPQLIRQDGLMKPTFLRFDVPFVPKPILKKASWYVQHRKTHLVIIKDPRDKNKFFYYFLVKDNPLGLKKITNASLQAYIDAVNGKKPKNQSYADLRKVCFSYHFAVQNGGYDVPECLKFNDAKINCPTCKNFMLYGICSHVCCINDILKNIDLEDLLKVTAEPRKGKRKGGSNMGVKPALVKEKPLPPGQCSECSDSDDEPLSKRLLRL